MRTRTALTSLALATGAAIALTGCGPSGGSGGPLDPDADVTITWWTGQADEAEAILEDLAAEFEADHPNVTIDVSPGASTTDDLLQKISAGFVGGTYPDISYAYGSWAGELGESGRTLDITDRIAEPAVGWDELPQVGRDTATPGGTTIGFPALVDNLAVVYNKTLFDAAGLDYPADDWTWEQFREAAKQLTDPSTSTYGFAYPVDGGEDTTWHLWPLLWQLGGEIVTADGSASAFDSPEGVQALDFLRSMTVEDKSVYLDQTAEKYGPLFASGQVGMIIAGPWQLYDIVQADTDYGVSYLPGFDGDHTTVAGPDIWALFDHQDANRAHWAFEFTSWLTQAEQDARFNLALGNLPLRASEKDLPEYAAFEQQYPGVGVFVDNFENATKVRPTIPGYVGLSTAVGEAVAEVLQGAATSEDALAEAAAEADKALGR
jgi:multiple sugar transport system substrate-binding protein